MTIKLISEIVQECSDAKTKQEKISILRNNDSPSLRIVLKFMYRPDIEYFTNVVPPYTKDDSPVGFSMNNLYHEAKRLYIFEKDAAVHHDRKHTILMQMLEALHSLDARLLEKIISNKKSDIKLNKTIVEEAFPNLLK
jgi:hypothetical protein